ncbi:30S ribosomal protein S11 [Clostridium sp. CAG:1000]|jgi:small subunit ribosomal protein S11|nr:30S ribosomal protein S11 [Clostridium sp. CAG:1000]
MAYNRRKRKAKRDITEGQAHIHSTFNNTIVTFTDNNGGVISWASSGTVGFKGSKKKTPFAAGSAAEAAGKVAYDAGIRKVEVFVKGIGQGRELAVRSITSTGIEITAINDVTPVPHNGCRPPKRRRI